MSDAESFAKGLVSGNDRIQLFHGPDQVIKPGIIQTRTILAEAVCIKSGFHFIKGKAPAEGIIQHRKAAVCGIHHTDNKDVVRNRKFLVRIKELEPDAAFII